MTRQRLRTYANDTTPSTSTGDSDAADKEANTNAHASVAAAPSSGNSDAYRTPHETDTYSPLASENEESNHPPHQDQRGEHRQHDENHAVEPEKEKHPEKEGVE